MKEFTIEKAEQQEGLIPKGERKYVPMFKANDNWFFALPIKNYSLMTIKECKEHIAKMVEIEGMSKEWKLAEFNQ